MLPHPNAPLVPARRILLALGTLVLAAAVSACGGDSGPLTPAARGTLSVQLTDAPFPFASVSRVDMYVVRIDAKQEEADSTEVARDTDAADDSAGKVHDGWVTIANPNRRFNLLDLQQGRTVNLGQTSLPAGEYRAFRFVLNTDSSSVTLADGRVLTGTSSPGIKFPSAGRSGIKVVLQRPVTVASTGSAVVLDFDLARSFVLRGNSIAERGLLFKPVIRAVARDIAGSVSGAVRGDSAAGVPVAYALVEILVPTATLADTAAANVVATARTDTAGRFRAAFVLPGSYQLRATPAAGSGYAPAMLPGGVMVAPSADVTGKVIVLPKAGTGTP